MNLEIKPQLLPSPKPSNWICGLNSTAREINSLEDEGKDALKNTLLQKQYNPDNKLKEKEAFSLSLELESMRQSSEVTC